MSATLLDRPPPRLERPPDPGRAEPAAPARPLRRTRWVLPAGLVLSALIHLVLLVTFRFEVTETPSARPPPIEVIAERPPGTRVYDIVAVEQAPPLPRELERPEPVVRAAPRTAAPVADAPARPAEEAAVPESGGRRATIAERLGPRMADRPELWERRETEPVPLSPEDAARARIADQLGAWNDSLRLAAEAGRRATDWTVTDENGGRWGISPGKIHLGSITLPLPVQFGPPPGRRDEVNAALRNWSEIQSQRSRAEGLEVIEDRIKAIRERKAAERRDTTHTSGTERRDTTRTSGTG